MSIRFLVNTDLNFGVGIIDKADNIIESKGFRKILLILDKNVQNNIEITNFRKRLSEKIQTDLFLNEMSEPDYDYLDSFCERIKAGEGPKEYDLIVAVGGGSTLDLAKGAAVVLKNGGPAINYKGFPKINTAPIPVVAIPTLAGTGSEIAYNAVFTDNQKQNRLGINTELNYPILSIVDPALSLSAPKSAVISGALDCFGHIMESYISINANHFTQELSKSAFELWFKGVNKFIEENDDVEGRSYLFSASILANMVLNNVGSGLGGSFSYPLGALYGVPHGIGEGIFIPYLVKFYINHGYHVYDELHDIIPGTDKSISSPKKNEDFVNQLEIIFDKLEVPKSLSIWGIGKEDINILQSEIEGAFHEAPVEFTVDDFRKMIGLYV